MSVWAQGAHAQGAYADGPICGTACCVAGNIAVAARELGFTPGPNPYNPKLVEDTPDFARRVWRETYGANAGSLLDFFNDHGQDYDEDGREVGGFAHDADGCRKDLEDVTPEEAVAHVRSTLPPGAL
jgi:hypothetical protein